MFFGCLADGPRVFKELAGIVWHAFEAFNRDFIRVRNDKFSSYNFEIFL